MSVHFVSLDLNGIFGRIFNIYIILSDFLQWKIDKIDGLKSSTGTWRTVKYPIPRKRALLLLSKSVFKTMGNSKEKFWGHEIQVLLSCNLSVPDTVVHDKNSDKTRHKNMFEHPLFNKSSFQASVHVNKTFLRDLVSFGRNK